MEPSRGRRLIAAGIITLGVTLGALAAWQRASSRERPAARAVTRDIPGQGQRVVVEVLNASGELGLARGVTRRLRDAGLDVVYFGTDAGRLDSTEVLVRRGSDDAKAERVRRALGAGRIRAAPDTTRLVDVTVRIGRDLALLGRDP